MPNRHKKTKTASGQLAARNEARANIHNTDFSRKSPRRQLEESPKTSKLRAEMRRARFQNDEVRFWRVYNELWKIRRMFLLAQSINYQGKNDA
jgi:hypothetical protein